MDESVLQLSCIKDEGRPFGIALQEEIPNHRKRLWSKAMVVSVTEKVQRDASGENQEDEHQ